jgi:hypothetical protein
MALAESRSSQPVELRRLMQGMLATAAAA